MWFLEKRSHKFLDCGQFVSVIQIKNIDSLGESEKFCFDDIIFGDMKCLDRTTNDWAGHVSCGANFETVFDESQLFEVQNTAQHIY